MGEEERAQHLSGRTSHMPQPALGRSAFLNFSEYRKPGRPFIGTDETILAEVHFVTCRSAYLHTQLTGGNGFHNPKTGHAGSYQEILSKKSECSKLS